MFTVVLVEPESDGNIGFVARVMKNFGIKDLILVNPKASLTEQVKAYSMHGYDVYLHSKKEESIKCLDKFDLKIGFTGNVNHESKILRNSVPLKELGDCISARGVALVFGRESRGLTNDELGLCDIISTIPANNEYPILNLSHAVAIVLYELMQHHYSVSTQIATLATKNCLLKYFDSLVEADTFKNPDVVKLAFKRMISRSGMTEKEAKALLTLFSKLSEKNRKSVL